MRGLSRAPHHPHPGLDALVVERLLEMRDHPPEGLGHTPGTKACVLLCRAMRACSRPDCACHARRAPFIDSSARADDCRCLPHLPNPIERPEPMQSGNTWSNAQRRRRGRLGAHRQSCPCRFYGRNGATGRGPNGSSPWTAQLHPPRSGLPVGSGSPGNDFPSGARVASRWGWPCESAIRITHHKMALSSTTAPLNRSVLPSITPRPLSGCAKSPPPLITTPTGNDPIKGSRVAIVLHVSLSRTAPFTQGS